MQGAERTVNPLLPNGLRLPRVQCLSIRERRSARSLGVALASVDVSEDYQRQRLHDVVASVSCFETDWQTLSNAAVMTTMVSGL